MQLTPELIANIAAMACGLPVFTFTLIYGVRVRWYKTLLGVAVFSLFLSLAGLFGMIVARRVVGFEWDWYQELAIGVYSYMLLSFIFFLSIFLVERRRGKEALSVPIGRLMTGEVPLPKPAER